MFFAAMSHSLFFARTAEKERYPSIRLIISQTETCSLPPSSPGIRRDQVLLCSAFSLYDLNQPTYRPSCCWLISRSIIKVGSVVASSIHIRVMRFTNNSAAVSGVCICVGEKIWAEQISDTFLLCERKEKYFLPLLGSCIHLGR